MTSGPQSYLTFADNASLSEIRNFQVSEFFNRMGSNWKFVAERTNGSNGPKAYLGLLGRHPDFVGPEVW